MLFPDPELLRTFNLIVETGSFTATARKVHRTQSAVSMQMRRLEEILGASLFQRAGKKLKLTADGEVFLDHARRILRQYEEAVRELSHNDTGGEITIGVPDDYAMTVLPELLARMVASVPQLNLTIVCEPSRKLSNLIADGSIDIALLTEGEGIGGGILLRRDELVWVTSARHDVHKRSTVPLAVFHSGDVFRRSAIERLESQGRHIKVVVSSTSFAGISAALDAGIAVAVISRGNVRPGFRILTPEEGFPQLPRLGIILQTSDRSPPALVKRLLQQFFDRPEESSVFGET